MPANHITTDRATSPSFHAVRHWLALCGNLLLILLLAQELANLTWEVVWSPPPLPQTTNDTPLPVPPPSSSVTDGTPSSPQHPILATRGLFGHQPHSAPLPPPRPSADRVVDGPSSLLLLGIYFTDNQASRALIGQPGQPEKSYQNGDTLPGEARLTAIHVDRVIVTRQGQHETLYLPKPGTIQAATSIGGGTAQLDPQVNAEVKQLWEQFRHRPESMLTHLRLEPAMENGKLLGVQLFPGADEQFLTKFGLQAGDIVTMVNGVELTDPLQGMAVLGQLATADTLKFRVQRGTTSYFFDFYLDPPPPGKP